MKWFSGGAPDVRNSEPVACPGPYVVEPASQVEDALSTGHLIGCMMSEPVTGVATHMIRIP